MNKSKAVIVTAVMLALGASGVVFAHGAGGGIGAGVGGGIGAGAGVGAGVGADMNMESHLNAKSLTNSNGSFATDRDFGRNRAADRMGQTGLSHEEATENTLKHKSAVHKTHKTRTDRDDNEKN